ncbi:MAG: flagellar hook-length control protein FliK [Alphaproteobacteria bacterium]
MNLSLLSLPVNPASGGNATASVGLPDASTDADFGQTGASDFAQLLVPGDNSEAVDVVAKTLVLAELEGELVTNVTIAQELPATLPPLTPAQEVLKNLAPVLSHKLTPQEGSRLLAAFSEFSGGEQPSDQLKALLESAATDENNGANELADTDLTLDAVVTVEDVVKQWLIETSDTRDSATATLQRVVQWLTQALPPQEEVLAQANALATFPDSQAAARTEEEKRTETLAVLMPGMIPVTPPETVTLPPATQEANDLNDQKKTLPEITLPVMGVVAKPDATPTTSDSDQNITLPVMGVVAKPDAIPTTSDSDQALELLPVQGEGEEFYGLSAANEKIELAVREKSASKANVLHGLSAFEQGLAVIAKAIAQAQHLEKKIDGKTAEVVSDSTSVSSVLVAHPQGTNPIESFRIHTLSVPSALQRADVAEQVHVALKRAAREGVDLMTVQLQPEDLGRVEVKLELSYDGMSRVSFLVDKRETFDALQRDAAQLERMLQDSGVRADAGTMQFNLRQESQTKEPFGEARDDTEEDKTTSVAAGSKTELSTQTYLHLVSDRVDIHA